MSKLIYVNNTNYHKKYNMDSNTFTICCSDNTQIIIDYIELIQGIPFFDTLLNTDIGLGPNLVDVQETGATMANIINMNYFNTTNFELNNEFMFAYSFFHCVLPFDDLDKFSIYIQEVKEKAIVDGIKDFLMPHQR